MMIQNNGRKTPIISEITSYELSFNRVGVRLTFDRPYPKVLFGTAIAPGTLAVDKDTNEISLIGGSVQARFTLPLTQSELQQIGLAEHILVAECDVLTGELRHYEVSLFKQNLSEG